MARKRFDVFIARDLACGRDLRLAGTVHELNPNRYGNQHQNTELWRISFWQRPTISPLAKYLADVRTNLDEYHVARS